MKQLHQLNIEEFRVRYDFTIEQISEMLQLPVSKYESVKHKALVHYSYHPEIKEFFIEDVEKEVRDMCERYGIRWGSEEKGILENTIRIKNDRNLWILEDYSYKLTTKEQPI